MRCLLLLLVVLLQGCAGAAQQSAELEADAFAAAVSAGAVQLLDVRTAGEFRNGHIPGSLQADWNNQAEFRQRTAALNPNQPVYIYLSLIHISEPTRPY